MRYDTINSVGYIDESEGVTDLGTIDLSEPDYSFDLAWIIGTPEGFYMGTDSGGSCHSPFEYYRSLDDFTGPLTADQAIEELESLARPFGGKAYDPERLAELITDIQNYAKENHA